MVPQLLLLLWFLQYQYQSSFTQFSLSTSWLFALVLCEGTSIWNFYYVTRISCCYSLKRYYEWLQTQWWYRYISWLANIFSSAIKTNTYIWRHNWKISLYFSFSLASSGLFVRVSGEQTEILLYRFIIRDSDRLSEFHDTYQMILLLLYDTWIILLLYYVGKFSILFLQL